MRSQLTHRIVVGTIAITASVTLIAGCSPKNQQDSEASSGTSTMTSSPVLETSQSNPTKDMIAGVNVSGVMPITFLEPVAEGHPLAVLAPCEGDLNANLTSTLSDKVAEMTPAADAGALMGDVAVPETIPPGPVGGHHTVTVKCASGQSATALVPTEAEEQQKPSNQKLEGNAPESEKPEQ